MQPEENTRAAAMTQCPVCKIKADQPVLICNRKDCPRRGKGAQADVEAPIDANQIEMACAIAYYNQKVRELKLAEDELNKLLRAALGNKP